MRSSASSNFSVWKSLLTIKDRTQWLSAMLIHICSGKCTFAGCCLLILKNTVVLLFSMQGLPGALGPVGYPGTRGVKVRHKCIMISGVMSTEIFIPSHISFCVYVYLWRTSCLSPWLTADRWRENTSVLKGTANNRVRKIWRMREMSESDRAELCASSPFWLSVLLKLRNKSEVVMRWHWAWCLFLKHLHIW